LAIIHLQQTLEKNILDNYLLEEVEFVLLDYNSKDGLGEWIQQNMQQYIESGILVYYKTFEPEYYLRSHSRNMAFRLANAEILCNLDADNFLGKGFALFIIDEFTKHELIFYTSDCSFQDIFGRVCVLQKDFYIARGYNEALTGYGYEDVDFFTRLYKVGLTQKYFYNPEFYKVIHHSKNERISEEYMIKNTKLMYISYRSPYQTTVLLLYNNHIMEQYTLIDNPHLNSLILSVNDNAFTNERGRITIQENFQKGKWQQEENRIIVQTDNNSVIFEYESSEFNCQGNIYYVVNDSELETELIILLTSAINFHKAKKQTDKNRLVNPDGFGMGTAFKNFNIDKEITLL
jgi:hypothetical protein